MTEPIPSDAQAADWLELATERLSTDRLTSRRIARVRRGRMLDVLGGWARRERGSRDPIDPELWSLIKLVGIDGIDDRGVISEFGEIVDRGVAIGFDPAALPHLAQAYLRAVGRIAAVEAGIMVRAMRTVTAEQRTAVIDDLLPQLLAVSLRAFDVLHRSLLQDALIETAANVQTDDPDLELLAIGMVDLVGSTGYLASATVTELQQMVDTIFAAGQAVTADRPAHVVKYVGDGLFIASSEVDHVADAALELVSRLQRDLPLQARGGIGYGPVIQRAGDVFGMPINLAQALSKAARPGTVLLSQAAAEMVPAAKRGRIRQRRLPNPAFGEQGVATLHP